MKDAHAEVPHDVGECFHVTGSAGQLQAVVISMRSL